MPSQKAGRASSGSQKGAPDSPSKDEKVLGKQTQEERRELRSRYRELGNSIGNRGQALQDLHGSEFDEVLDQHEELFTKVQQPREAVLDAQNMAELSKVPLQQIELLANATARYNPEAVIKALKDRVKRQNNNVLDWRKLGAMVAPCFRSVPDLDFMYGPLDKPLTERKERVKRKRPEEEEDVEEARPEKVETHAEDDETSGATAARIKRLNLLVDEHDDAAKEHRTQRDIDLFKLAFNPNSFTQCGEPVAVADVFNQTVENMFDLSFMCNRRTAKLKVENGVPMVEKLEDDDVAETPRQCIVSLTMKDWRELVKKHDIDRSVIPDREGYEEDAHVGAWIEQKKKETEARN